MDPELFGTNTSIEMKDRNCQLLGAVTPIFFFYEASRVVLRRCCNFFPKKTKMTNWKSTMNEDVFPIEHGDFPFSHVSFGGCTLPGRIT